MRLRFSLLLSLVLLGGTVLGSEAVSPDGRNRIVYEAGRISVFRDGTRLLGPQRAALELANGSAPRLELAARNDGVAYRFVAEGEGEITVRDEIAEIVFPSAETELWVGYNWCDNPKDPKQDKLQHGCASVYTKTTPAAFVPDGRRLAYLPLTARYPDGTTLLVTESDLRDYAGWHLRRNAADTNRLVGVFGKYPVREKEYWAPRNYRRVREREDFIVKTCGPRTFPWRVFVLAETPIKLVEQRIVRDLAAPAQGDYSWVRPGLATWEWWSDWHLDGVDFTPGVNTATYLEYIRFAADYHLDWLLVDEGWCAGDDLFALTPGFDLAAIVACAAARNVQVMLWTPWRALDGREEEIFAHYAARGVKGFKVDFMERDDAEMMRFMERVLRTAAKHRLCIDFHGCGKPTGLEKTHPNLIGVEGVHGLELMKLGFAKNDDFPAHDCQIVFTRAPLGMVDYTPGAMVQKPKDLWKPDHHNPASQGTRAHQLALYVLFPVPFQMLCDSPSRYRAEPDYTRLLCEIPTTWDEVRGLAGEIGKFATVARRKGKSWYLGAITDGQARTLAVDLSFFGEGVWQAEILADAPEAETHPERYVRSVRRVTPSDRLMLDLAPGGGAFVRFTVVSGE